MELLVVMLILGMIMALAAPKLFSVMRARELTTQGEGIRNWLSLAQQQALSTNSDVEVRFYKVANLNDGQVEPEFRSLQYYQYNRSGDLVPASQIMTVQNPISISSKSKLSNIVSPTLNDSYGRISDPEELERLFGDAVEEAVEYAAFRFRPDGSTDLDTSQQAWYFTLVEDGNTSDEIPSNFVCLQIDAYNGTIREHRP